MKLRIILSAGLLIFGCITLILVYWPALAGAFSELPSYQPKLPVAEDREEPFYDIEIEKSNIKTLYPPLTSPIDVGEGNWIRVPSIGVNVPLVESLSMDDEDVVKTLEMGAALYPNGIMPGRLGNIFISAHSTGEPWKGKYRFAFIHIDKLHEGSLLHIDYSNTRYTYRVVSKDLVKPNDETRVISGRPVPTVTIMACWPLWSTSQRMLVTGELTNITKLTKQPS
ncbi:MAG: class E sortase [bacterium]